MRCVIGSVIDGELWLLWAEGGTFTHGSHVGTLQMNDDDWFCGAGLRRTWTVAEAQRRGDQPITGGCRGSEVHFHRPHGEGPGIPLRDKPDPGKSALCDSQTCR